MRRGATAAAAGVVTLKSQPGMASIICTSPSANASFTLFQSVHPGQLTSCDGGLSPGAYKNNAAWSSLCGPNTPFDKAHGGPFTCYNNPRSKYLINQKMSLIIDASLFPEAYDSNRIAMHTICAYQNALMGLTPFVQPGQIIAIWNSYAQNGWYKPLGNTTTTVWYALDIVNYLTGTYHGA